MVATPSILLAAILSGTANQSVPDRPQLFVAGVKAERGVDAGLARVIGDLLLDECSKTSRYRVVGGSDIEAMLTAEQQKQIAGCTDTSCVAEILGAMGAEHVMAATLGRIGSSYFIALKIVNTKKGVVEGRWADQVPTNEDALAAAARRGVAGLLAQTNANAAASPAIAPAAVAPAAVESPVTASPPIASPFWSWPVLTLTGVAVAAAGVGGYFGIEAAKYKGWFDQDRPGAQVYRQKAYDNAKMANIFYASAAVAALAGGGVWWWKAASSAAPHVALVPGAKEAAIVATWTY